MKVEDIIFSKQGIPWVVLSLPDDSGWLLVKNIIDGLIYEHSIRGFIFY